MGRPLDVGKMERESTAVGQERQVKLRAALHLLPDCKTPRCAPEAQSLTGTVECLMWPCLVCLGVSPVREWNHWLNCVAEVKFNSAARPSTG